MATIIVLAIIIIVSFYLFIYLFIYLIFKTVSNTVYSKIMKIMTIETVNKFRVITGRKTPLFILMS